MYQKTKFLSRNFDYARVLLQFVITIVEVFHFD